ncbi:MAG: tautomerase family protein [Actinobacteria bacterium]|nr:tautomerase family protein [Actinomycetota bacterium]
MPYLEIKAFEERFEDENVAPELIAALTDAVVSVFGEDARDATWVVVEGVPRNCWGFGGKVTG